MKKCDVCGNERECTTTDYETETIYCDDCYCETHSCCANCGEEVLDENLKWSDISCTFLCESCFDEEEDEDE